MGKHDTNEEQPTPGKEHEKKPFRFKLGPIEVEGPLGLGGSLLVGLIAGVGLTLYAVIQLQQPSFLIGPVVSSAVSATMTAQPTATPTPTATPMPTATPTPTATPPPVVRVIDVSTGKPIYPERGKYFLNPSQRIRVRLEPAEGKECRWWLSKGFGQFEERSPTGPEVTFIAPQEPDKHGIVHVCEPELYAHYECRVGSLRDILIGTFAGTR